MSGTRKGYVVGRRDGETLTYLTNQLFWLEYDRLPNMKPFVHVPGAIKAVRNIIEDGHWAGPEPDFLQEAIDDPILGRKITGEPIPFLFKEP